MCAFATATSRIARDRPSSRSSMRTRRAVSHRTHICIHKTHVPLYKCARARLKPNSQIGFTPNCITKIRNKNHLKRALRAASRRRADTAQHISIFIFVFGWIGGRDVNICICKQCAYKLCIIWTRFSKTRFITD